MDAFHQLFDIAPSTISVHFCLSLAIFLAFSKDQFSSWSSFRTALSHVVFGLPLGRVTFRMPSARACFTGASSGSLNRWPIHSSLFFLIFLASLNGFCFGIEIFVRYLLFGHSIFKIFCSSDLWKMLMSSASFLSESRARRCTKRCFLCMRWRLPVGRISSGMIQQFRQYRCQYGDTYLTITIAIDKSFQAASETYIWPVL